MRKYAVWWRSGYYQPMQMDYFHSSYRAGSKANREDAMRYLKRRYSDIYEIEDIKLEVER